MTYEEVDKTVFEYFKNAYLNGQVSARVAARELETTEKSFLLWIKRSIEENKPVKKKEEVVDLPLKEKIRLGLRCKAFFKVKYSTNTGWCESVVTQIYYPVTSTYAIVGFKSLDKTFKEIVYYRVDKSDVIFDGNSYYDYPFEKEGKKANE